MHFQPGDHVLVKSLSRTFEVIVIIIIKIKLPSILSK